MAGYLIDAFDAEGRPVRVLLGADSIDEAKIRSEQMGLRFVTVSLQVAPKLTAPTIPQPGPSDRVHEQDTAPEPSPKKPTPLPQGQREEKSSHPSPTGGSPKAANDGGLEEPPHLLFPRSRSAQKIFWAIGALLFISAVLQSSNANNRDQGAVFFVVLASGLVGWGLLVAVFRYAFFVYPYERRKQRTLRKTGGG
ncbi:MAG: hypothetical protein J0L61_11080 [Planctomycetes bacterium]|nr:hypothetical protein [Planctomycetota bacterium]